MKQVNTIYILPFAGGSSYLMKPLKDLLSPFFNTVVLEYPGRGTRFAEPLKEHIDELADDLLQQMNINRPDSAYTVYGHCMGGLMAWLLTKKAAEKKLPLPAHLFISGTGGPAGDNSYIRELIKLNDRSLMHEFIASGNDSMFQDIFEDEDLFDLFKDIIRADVHILASFSYSLSEKLPVPATIINGSEDATITAPDIRLWADEICEIPEFINLPGDHFFIFPKAVELTEIIRSKSTDTINPGNEKK